MTLTIKNTNTQIDDDLLRNAMVTINAIKNKIGDIRCSNGTIILSNENLLYLIENYNRLPLEVISKKIKRKPNTIRNIVKKLRLTSYYLGQDEYILYNLLNKLGIQNGWYTLKIMIRYGLPIKQQGTYYTIKLADFYGWLINHIRICDLHDYVIGTLPNEPDWFIEKVQADKRAYVYMRKRSWTTDEDNLLKQLVEEHKTYNQISKVLKRTGNSIKRRCYDLKIDKPRRTPPKAWTVGQVENLRTLWLKGYQPCIIAEEINRSDREIQAYLERKEVRYFGKPPEKFRLDTLQ